ncbi:MAG: glycosyltransferase family 87 protein [Mariniblastus sp.]
MTPAECEQNSTTATGQLPSVGVPWMTLGLPILAAALIFFFSPNFRVTGTLRTAPLGGDFLQEWIGATVLSGEQASKLYERQYVDALQHDPQVVGFAWPETSYFPMVYPPFYYSLLRPLAGLEYPTASKLWLVLSAVAFSIVGWLVYRFYPASRDYIFAYILAAVLFAPFLNSLVMGQKSVFLLLILLGAYLLLRCQRPFIAGLVFGLIAFKPHLGLVIGLAMLAKRQWSFAAGAVSVVGAFVTYSCLFQGELWGDYLHVVSQMDNYLQTHGYQLEDAHSLWGAVTLAFHSQPLWFSKLSTVVLSLLVVCLLWRAIGETVALNSDAFARQFSAMIIATVLLSPHFYGYDLTILLLPFLLILSTTNLVRWRKMRSERVIVILVLVCFGLSGAFSEIAGSTHVQSSTVLLIALLLFLARVRSDDCRAIEQAGENSCD